MTTAWFQCFSGIAGDMALGALIDAGAPVAEVEAALATLDVQGWQLEVSRCRRAGVAATRAFVRFEEGNVHRGLTDVVAIIESGRLPARALQRSLAVFTRLAQAEADVHGIALDEVHFHEVGAVDAIVDVVGTCVALELLGVDEVGCGAVAVGAGTVRAAHGLLPNPAPAVVRLLEGFEIRGVETDLELTTPTGAALVAALTSRHGAVPAMTLRTSGMGAGSRDTNGRPNVTQVLIGEATAETGATAGQPVALLEANVDDVSGEVLAHALARLLDAGAHDAWTTPILMKKGRPAHTVHALCDPALRARLAEVFVTELGTLGVRATMLERWPSRRSTITVTVAGHRIAVTSGPSHLKAEFDHVAAAARATGRSVRDVRAEAESLARAEVDDPTGAW